MLLFLIKLLSVLEMNLTPKAKVSLRVLKIQHPKDGFESQFQRALRSLPERADSNPLCNGFESQFQNVSESLLKQMDSNLIYNGFES